MFNRYLFRATRKAVPSVGVNLSQMVRQRKFSTLVLDNYEKCFLTSNMFCLVRNPLFSRPFISVTQNIRIPIDEGKTISDLETESASQNGTRSLDFYTHDGARIARSTSAETLCSLPYFKLTIDQAKEYIVISEKSFSFQNQKYELEGNVKQYYDY